MPAEPRAPTLQYAQPEAIPRRLWRWSRRGILLLWAAGTLYLAYDKWGVWSVMQYKLLRAQSRCLSFQEPAGKVVFERYGSDASKTLSGPGYRQQMVWQSAIGSPSSQLAVADVATHADDVRKGLQTADDALIRTNASRHPPPRFVWEAGMEPVYEFERLVDASLVFLHELKTRDGPARLVGVRVGWYTGKGSYSMGFSVEVLEPATITGQIKHCFGKAIGMPDGHPRDNTGVSDGYDRLYAGRIDPDNPARFTIEYENANGRGTIQGTLKPNGEVEVRDLGIKAAAPGRR